jgi:hypothetical protein
MHWRVADVIAAVGLEPLGASAARLTLAISLLLGSSARAAITISSNPTSNMSCASGTCLPTAKDAVLNVTDLQNLLATGNVKVTTTGAGVQANDIKTSAAFYWSSANTLTLDARRSITVNRPVSVGGSAGVALVSDDGGTGGELSFGPEGNIRFGHLSSRLTINGMRYALVNTIAGLARGIVKNPRGFFAFARSYNASGDNYRSTPIKPVFTGNFQGLGNVISNLNIDDPLNGAQVGFFDKLAPSAAIANLGLANVDIKGADHSLVAGLVVTNLGTLVGDSVTGALSTGQFGAVGGMAWTSGSGITGIPAIIEDSHVTVSVSGYYGSSFSDLVEHNDGVIRNIYATGRHLVGGTVIAENTGLVTNSFSTVKFAYGGGGLVGINMGVVADSYATGDVGKGGGDGLVGQNQGLVVDCYATGNIAGGGAGLVLENLGLILNAFATGNVGGGGGGGLVATNGGMIENSYATGDVTGKTNNNDDNGGLVGQNSGRVENSHATGNVTGGKYSVNGGLVGVGGIALNSYATGTVTGGDHSSNGGLVGEQGGDSVIANSYATGAVTGGVFSVNGGLLGSNDSGLITNTFATGSVTGTDSESTNGGLVGVNGGTIANSYATGAVSSSGAVGSWVGGLVGENFDVISDSYSTGAVSGQGNDSVGGLIGYDFSNSGDISNTYWNTTTSGITNLSQGAGNIANDPGITGLTTVQFQSGLPAGFDPKVWAENPDINGDLPYLLSNPPRSVANRSH